MICLLHFKSNFFIFVVAYLVFVLLYSCVVFIGLHLCLKISFPRTLLPHESSLFQSLAFKSPTKVILDKPFEFSKKEIVGSYFSGSITKIF